MKKSVALLVSSLSIFALCSDAEGMFRQAAKMGGRAAAEKANLGKTQPVTAPAEADSKAAPKAKSAPAEADSKAPKEAAGVDSKAAPKAEQSAEEAIEGLKAAVKAGLARKPKEGAASEMIKAYTEFLGEDKRGKMAEVVSTFEQLQILETLWSSNEMQDKELRSEKARLEKDLIKMENNFVRILSTMFDVQEVLNGVKAEDGAGKED